MPESDEEMEGLEQIGGMTVTLSDGERLTIDSEMLEKEFRKLSRGLEGIGLSPYEAKVYISLVAHGYGSAETIAQTAKVPRTSAYKILQSLVEKGFAVATEGRPRIYRPEAPMRVYRRVNAEIKGMFEKLDMLYEMIREKGEPQIIYTIHGKNRVIEKIGELLDKCTESFIIATPNFNAIYHPLERKIRSAMDRGIKVTIITRPSQRVPQGAEVVRKETLVATDIVSDGQEAILASSDLSACGFTDNASLAEHLKRFLQILIEH